MDGLYIPYSNCYSKELEGGTQDHLWMFKELSQTATPEFAIEGTNNNNNNNEKVKITPDFDYLSKLVDPTTGNVINDPVFDCRRKRNLLI